MSKSSKLRRQAEQQQATQRLEAIRLRVTRGLKPGLVLGERRQMLALAQATIDRVALVEGQQSPTVANMTRELVPLQSAIMQQDASHAAAQCAKLGNREPTTVGELRALLASLPAATPLESIPERLQAQAAKALGLLPAPKAPTAAKCSDGVTPLGYWLERRRGTGAGPTGATVPKPPVDAEANGGLW